MAGPFFSAQTLDDVMRSVIKEIQSNGEWIKPSRGGCTELTGILLEITNPRARLSRTETRGRPFSCLGELCWYLAGTNELNFIRYYIREYNKSANGGVVVGGYGPRLFDWRGVNQLAKITEVLKRKRSSRQAIIQLFDASDLAEEHNSIPCTCTLQFMIRNDRLQLLTSMRSNDVFWGLPHDVFAFTMLQEIVARSLSVELGTYKHFVGSFHLYDEQIDEAKQFLHEGWQSTTPMPPMPDGDPWPAIRSLLSAESAIRNGDGLDANIIERLDSYWADLIRLLLSLRYRKDKEPEKIVELRATMSSRIYDPFIERQLRQLS